MKKILSILLTLLIPLTVFVGCNPNNSGKKIPKGLTGTDVAKLLLADQRLDADLLKKEEDIFDEGVKVMNTLAQKATENLEIMTLSQSSERRVTTFSGNKQVVSKPTDDGLLQKDDTHFYFSNFSENNNSLDYFENLTTNIVISAEVGADLIDHVKKNIRVVDRWVKNDDVAKYYLHVEENREIIIEKYTNEGLDITNICMRYKNTKGKDVYELYRDSMTENYSERMLYIPNERYELVQKHGWSRGNDLEVFVADKTKGYWENAIISLREGRPSVSYFVMKDNLCYDANYNLTNKKISTIKFMSGDRATDILNLYSRENDLEITLKFSGFDGIKDVSAKTSDVEYNQTECYANIINPEVATLNLVNGKSINTYDNLMDGKIDVNAIYTSYNSICTGELMLIIREQGFDAQFQIFKQFLTEYGLVCRRDINTVYDGILTACYDSKIVAEYYKWNGINLTDANSVIRASELEHEKINELLNIYKEVQNATSIDINDTSTMQLNMSFAPITAMTNSGSANATKISIEEISLSIEDTLLFVTNESYKVSFAFADNKGKLVHVETKNNTSVNFVNQKPFSVTANTVEFDMPLLGDGNYTLVAYIATMDGIRTSDYKALSISLDSNPTRTIDNFKVTISKAQDESVVVNYERIKDFNINLQSQIPLSYEEFKRLLTEKAFEYGIPSDDIEFETNAGVYAHLPDTTEIVLAGKYRIGYRLEKDTNTLEGYIYVNYSVI